MRHYTFNYFGYIPSSREIDNDTVMVSAISIEDAWEKVKKMKLFPKSEVTLHSINGIKVEESLRAMPEALVVVKEEETSIPIAAANVELFDDSEVIVIEEEPDVEEEVTDVSLPDEIV